MAVFNCHFQPRTLGMSTTFRMIIPMYTLPSETNQTRLKEYYSQLSKLPVLWLLHGGGGYSSEWLYNSAIQLYAEKYHCAVIMPDAQSSLYTNMEYGPRWEDHIAMALPEYIYKNFPISSAREDNYIAGMSMGGYGALRIALKYPEQYCAVAAMASAVGLPLRYAENKLSDDFDAVMHAVLGDKDAISGSDYDLYSLVDQYCKQENKLKLYLCAGRNDHTYEDNIELRDYLTKIDVKYTWVENDDAHTWDSWNTYLPQVMEWMFNHKKEKE